MSASAANTTTKVLLTDLASSVNHVPSNSMQPISDCPNLSDVQPLDVSIPLIGQARQQDGFFQLKNHGIPDGSDTIDQLHAPKLVAKHRNNDLNNLMVAFCFAASMAIALLPIEVHSQLHSSLLWLALAVQLGFTSFFLSIFIDSRFVVTVRVLQKFGQFFVVTAFYVAISLRFSFYFKCISLAVYFISFLTIFISSFYYPASSVNHVLSNNILPISDRPNLSDVQPSDASIPETLFSTIMNRAREFFRLKESERMKSYSDDPTKITRLSTSFNVKTEKISDDSPV